MPMNFDPAVQKLTNANTYISVVGAAAVGYMAPFVVDNLADRFLPWDAPDEAAGLATIGAIEMFGGMGYKRALQYGAGAYTGVTVAERFEVRDTVESLGGA